MSRIAPKPIIADVVQTWEVPPGMKIALVEDIQSQLWIVESCPAGTHFWTLAQAQALPQSGRTGAALRAAVTVALKLRSASVDASKRTVGIIDKIDTGVVANRFDTEMHLDAPQYGSDQCSSKQCSSNPVMAELENKRPMPVVATSRKEGSSMARMSRRALAERGDRGQERRSAHEVLVRTGRRTATRPPRATGTCV